MNMNIPGIDATNLLVEGECTKILQHTVPGDAKCERVCVCVEKHCCIICVGKKINTFFVV